MKKWALFLAVLGGIGIGAFAAEPRILFDFEDPGQRQSVKELDSSVAIVQLNGSEALKIETGATRPYPNVTLHAPEGGWDLSAFDRVEIDVTNLSDESLKIGARVDNEGGTGRVNSCSGSVGLDPHETARLVVRFNRRIAEKLSEKLTGMRYTPWGLRAEYGGSIDPAKVVQINIFMNKPTRRHAFAIDNVRAAGAFDPAAIEVPDPFFPFIDRYGQYIHRDWPGKVKTDADLTAARKVENASMQAMPRPASWDKYGGWANGPALKATGHFYTAKHHEKWYLVDPEGRLFFSIGMDVVQPHQRTGIAGRDDWFADPPWKDEAFKDQLFQTTPRRGVAKGKTVDAFDFYAANLQRKYGEKWESIWMELIPHRLMNWGFNTLGCWSDPQLLPTTTLPYTHWVYINAGKLPWRMGTRNRVSDPFNPGFETELRRRAATMTRGTVKDPYCIGYFVDNELSWGNDTYLATAVVTGEPDEAAKIELIKWLRQQYGEIAKLNQAWKVNVDSWKALAAFKEIPTTEQAQSDLRSFNEKIVRTYFQTVRAVLKDVAPDKLYLGCRFAESNPQVVRVAAEYCDIVSFNLYRDTVAAWAPPTPIDKPILIGEFHFGSTDQGVFGPGLVRAENAQDRAAGFKRYVTGAATNPQLVGAHWFQLIDEPTSGRTLDAENHNIGFLTITDTPYDSMIQASREAASSIYDLRAAGRSD